MRNFKIEVEYDGTNYFGWQLQNGGSSKTIQGTIEKAIRKVISKEKPRLTASGRTDSGVHAQAQIANFKTRSKIESKQLQNALNTLLPKDIRIRQIQEVDINFHARFDAKSKLYSYTIINDKIDSAFLHPYTTLIKYNLDIRMMKKASKILLGRHDFRSFQAADKKDRHSVRKIKRLDIKKENKLITVYIEANGFLYKMVRNIVGTLIDVGRGRISPEDVKTILKAKDRSFAGVCAPAKGLKLLKVYYANNER